MVDICEVARISKAKMEADIKEMKLQNDREAFNAVLFRKMAEIKEREKGGRKDG